MDRNILNIVNIAYLVIFIVLLNLSAFRLLLRILDYWMEDLPIPLLVKRDAGFLFGFSLPFTGLLVIRVMNLDIGDSPWYPLWIILSGGLAIIGMAYWTWIEFFRIENPNHDKE